MRKVFALFLLLGGFASAVAGGCTVQTHGDETWKEMMHQTVQRNAQDVSAILTDMNRRISALEAAKAPASAASSPQEKK